MAKQAGRELRAALMASRGAFLMTGVFSFFINLLMLTSPLYMLQIYDRVLASRSEATLVVLTLLAGGLLVVMAMLDLIRSRVLIRVSARIDQDLSPRVFDSAFSRSLQGAGGQRAQTLRDMDSLRQFLTGPGPFAFFDAPWVPLYLLIVFLFHPVLGLVSLVGGMMLFAIALLNDLAICRPLQVASSEAITAASFAEASLRSSEALKAMGMLPAIRKRWISRHNSCLELQALASDRAAALMATSKTARIALQIAILCAGAALAMQQLITPGVMVAASIIMGRALAPVDQAISQWRQFVNARSAYHRLSEALEQNPVPAAGLVLPRPKGDLTVERLVAIPPGATKTVLNDVSFRLLTGEALGVIGPSASGKSTLARLLVGAWHPESGAVRLDGAEVHGWKSEDLGPYIGYLPQDVELFAGTVAENISRFADTAESEAIVTAARQAGVHNMILQLDKGYDTEIGEQGRVLSGGQRQRIGLARALYGKPVLVVFDEPNSNLDAAGDGALRRAIEELKRQGTTVIVMAHRSSALASVDKLLLLRNGRVEAFGPKEDILGKMVRAPVETNTGGNVASLCSNA